MIVLSQKNNFYNGELKMASEDEVFDALKYRIHVKADGSKLYYNNKDAYHREDGPAVELANGRKWWYINGKQLTDKQFLQWRKDNNK